MTWSDLSNYLLEIPEGFLSDLLANCEFPWTPLSRLPKQIEQYFKGTPARGALLYSKTTLYNADGSFKEGALHINETSLLKEPVVVPDFHISIDSGTLVEAGATIKNHTIIGKNCEIRQGAYIRGNCYIGDRSVVGHTTEMKNSIFIRHVEAGHFAYIGDSIIGSYVNLGAGTKISNLEFRSLEAKKKDQFPEIIFRTDGQRLKTGIAKFGAIIGDGCETGCNSVLSPFVFLEPKCWILPNVCVTKGVYNQKSIIRSN